MVYNWLIITSSSVKPVIIKVDHCLYRLNLLVLTSFQLLLLSPPSVHQAVIMWSTGVNKKGPQLWHQRPAARTSTEIEAARITTLSVI